MNKLLPLAFLFFVSCGGIKVAHDYDRKLDYAVYRVYDFFEPMDTRLGPLDSKRVLFAIDRVLQAKGYAKATGDQKPQFFVNVKSEMYQSASSGGSIGIGVGGTGSNVGGGVNMGIPVGDPTLKQVIYFDLVDVKKDALFWQARTEATYMENISPEKREKRMLQIVEKAFEAFPPELKK